MSGREYGAAGLVGILPPQANATVEAELGVLLGPGVATLVSRLVCPDPDSRARLVGYFHYVEQALRAFDAEQPDVVLFACTGSSYLLEREEEAGIFSKLNVVSAAQAIYAALEALGARRIALVSPYPGWLSEACASYWKSRGLEVVAMEVLEGDRSDTRKIYQLTSADAQRGLGRLNVGNAQAVVVTGTGMPSLRALGHAGGLPVVSSNLCLAWQATQRLLGKPCDAPSLLSWLAQDAPWRARLAARFPRGEP